MSSLQDELIMIGVSLFIYILWHLLTLGISIKKQDNKEVK